MKARALLLATALLLAPVAGCSKDEPVATERTTTTVPLEDLDVADLDPLAAVDVTVAGPSPDSVPLDAESVDDIGGGQLSVTAFVPTCAQVAEVLCEDRLARVMVTDRECDGPLQLVRVTVPAPPGYTKAAP